MLKIFPENYALAFQSTRPLTEPLDYFEAFGSDAKLSFKKALGLYCLNRFIKEGAVDRAGIWLLYIENTSFWKARRYLIPDN